MAAGRRAFLQAMLAAAAGRRAPRRSSPFAGAACWTARDAAGGSSSLDRDRAPRHHQRLLPSTRCGRRASSPLGSVGTPPRRPRGAALPADHGRPRAQGGGDPGQRLPEAHGDLEPDGLEPLRRRPRRHHEPAEDHARGAAAPVPGVARRRRPAAHGAAPLPAPLRGEKGRGHRDRQLRGRRAHPVPPGDGRPLLGPALPRAARLVSRVIPGGHGERLRPGLPRAVARRPVPPRGPVRRRVHRALAAARAHDARRGAAGARGALHARVCVRLPQEAARRAAPLVLLLRAGAQGRRAARDRARGVRRLVPLRDGVRQGLPPEAPGEEVRQGRARGRRRRRRRAERRRGRRRRGPRARARRRAVAQYCSSSSASASRATRASAR